MQRQNVAISALRIVLLAALAVVLYVPVTVLLHEGNESHGHLYAILFPIAWVTLVLSAWLMARTYRKLAIVSIILATAAILLYYGLPRVAY